METASICNACDDIDDEILLRAFLKFKESVEIEEYYWSWMEQEKYAYMSEDDFAGIYLTAAFI